MMQLTIAPEPSSFKTKVREPGENALALLAGEPLPHKRLGRPLTLMKTVGGASVRKTIDDFPYWQDCLDDLHAAYDGICAYYCFRVEQATIPHVDHFLAKSDRSAALAYDWRNYRFACGHANARKNKFPDVLDPASIQDGWFQLDLDTLAVHADPSLPSPLRERVEATIERLQLHKGRALEVRRRAMSKFRRGMQMEFLAEDHPYLARELARQGIHTKEQLPSIPASLVEAREPELS